METSNLFCGCCVNNYIKSGLDVLFTNNWNRVGAIHTSGGESIFTVLIWQALVLFLRAGLLFWSKFNKKLDNASSQNVIFVAQARARKES